MLFEVLSYKIYLWMFYLEKVVLIYSGFIYSDLIRGGACWHNSRFELLISLCKSSSKFSLSINISFGLVPASFNLLGSLLSLIKIFCFFILLKSGSFLVLYVLSNWVLNPFFPYAIIEKALLPTLLDESGGVY